MKDRERALRAGIMDAMAFGVEDLLAPRKPPAVVRSEGSPGPESRTPTPLPPPEAPVGSEVSRADDLLTINREIDACTRCGLSGSRTQAVPGEGKVPAEILFIGEAPGADEDREGRPFVGVSGQLLTKMIEAMGFQRGDVFIANVLKCRPPGNRDPEPTEVTQCLPYLLRQVRLVRPKVIVTLGAHAMRSLLGGTSLGSMRGTVHTYDGIPVVVTYHPAYLLRTPAMKRGAWEDLQMALRVLRAR